MDLYVFDLVEAAESIHLNAWSAAGILECMEFYFAKTYLIHELGSD